MLSVTFKLTIRCDLAKYCWVRIMPVNGFQLQTDVFKFSVQRTFKSTRHLFSQKPIFRTCTFQQQNRGRCQIWTKNKLGTPPPPPKIIRRRRRRDYISVCCETVTNWSRSNWSIRTKSQRKVYFLFYQNNNHDTIKLCNPHKTKFCLRWRVFKTPAKFDTPSHAVRRRETRKAERPKNLFVNHPLQKK